MGLRVFGGFLAGAMGAGILLHAIFLRWPPDGVLWFGDTGVVASVAAVLGVIGAFAAAFGALHTYRQGRDTLAQAREAEVATRFQTAAGMLNNPDTAVAGVAVLQQVALAAPDRYAEPTMATLAAHLARSGGDEVDARWKYFADGEQIPPLVRMATSTPSAFAALGRVHEAAPTTQPEDIRGRYPLRRLYLHETTIVSTTLAGLQLDKVVMGDVVFQGISFANTHLSARVMGIVAFQYCDLTDARLFLHPLAYGRFIFFNCSNLDGAEINGKPLALFLEDEAQAAEEERQEIERMVMEERFPFA